MVADLGGLIKETVKITNNMDADIRGCIKAIKKAYRMFSYKGKPLTESQVMDILLDGVSKGYKSRSEITDGDIENALRK